MMKANLKRIEQTLHRLEQPTAIASGSANASTVRQPNSSGRSVSFEVSSKSGLSSAVSVSSPSSINLSAAIPTANPGQSQPIAQPETSELSDKPELLDKPELSDKSEPITPLSGLHLPTPHRVPPIADLTSIDLPANPPAPLSASFQLATPEMPASTVSDATQTIPTSKALHLPKMKSVHFSSHRNGANPGLAASLLREMLGIAEGWQAELAQVVRHIQDLYIEGPIVDGWLESTGDLPHAETVAFKHAEISQLIQFVEKLQSGEIQPERVLVNGAGYRLCGLNADGRVWSCPCPADQVPTVSLAIARHHRLRQLLSRQQELESRLGQLSEDLVMLHSRLKQ
ncbi:hypothetical protein [Alkalinema sp. FACHB-956]|uniref:hypothetical protein n=1 Tax=Alkalinema sp. FACHB-956 TaxID=2692768 RepID=UPI0016847AAE|nr:hypothetical protein [Alkalinema sp. FACHB-956]MBD2328762.1 hypothetical protein [Alkalinema sp. FACHB-956]